MPGVREEEADTMGAVDGMILECISRFPLQLGMHQKNFFLTLYSLRLVTILYIIIIYNKYTKLVMTNEELYRLL